MNLKCTQSGAAVIVYDGDVLDQPDPQLFQAAYWHSRSAVRAEARGRGNALVLDTDFGPAVLRNYRRGGWASKVSSGRYLYTGFGRSRPVVEFRLLARLLEMGLPVPQPLAGLCLRHGLAYSAALLTREVPRTRTLADFLVKLDSEHPLWHEVGACVRRFHDAGVVHADLNARNILLSETEAGKNVVYLVDFDRGRIGQPNKRASAANLRRLKRSLVKLWPNDELSGLEQRWSQLVRGYRSALIATSET